MSLPRLNPTPTLTAYPDAEPGVYLSGVTLDGRPVWFARGPGGVLLDTRRARGMASDPDAETDAEVVSDLRALYRAAMRAVATLDLIGPSGEVRRSVPAASSVRPRRRGPVLPR